MLKITIPSIELYDDAKEEFAKSKGQVLQLEHSLVSLSKWESKWCKPFLGKTEKTPEETSDYIRCMTITQNVDPDVYKYLTNGIIDKISEYIDAPMTATTFPKDKQPGNREIVTAELIYYWMIALNIPMECEKWHLNRLLTLTQVCNIKNQPPKKMGKKETMSRNSSINAARRQSMNTNG